MYLCAVYVGGILHILLLRMYFRSKVLLCTATLLVVLCCYKKIICLCCTSVYINSTQDFITPTVAKPINQDNISVPTAPFKVVNKVSK